MTKFFVIVILQLSTVFEWTGGEENYVTSTVNLQKLARHEQKVVQYLHTYSTQLENKIDNIKRYLKDYTASWNSHEDDDLSLVEFENSTFHLLRSTRMLRRFAIDLANIEIDTQGNETENFLSVMDNFPVPTPTDRADSILSLLVLIDSYSLSAKQVSSGKLLNIETKSGLSSSQCLELGQFALKKELFSTSIDFLNEALYLLLNSKKDPKIVQITSEIIKEKINVAIKQHDEKLEAGLKAQLFGNFFSTPLVEFNHKSFFQRKRSRVNIVPIAVDSNNFYVESMFNNFKTLCTQGYSQPINENLSDMKCYLYSKVHPYWILSPLKVEIHHKNPLIFQIYDVLTNEKIEILKEAAKSTLQPSRVFGTKKSVNITNILEGNETSFHRSSQTMFLDDRTTNTYNFINILTEILTGLSAGAGGVASAELLQIGNYATGGQYIPHLDAFHFPGFASTYGEVEIFVGDRIGTMMTYLSDVEGGGGTAFPNIGVIARAVKHSALFWLNLYQNGTIDPFTLHGGCPVLYGNKWVANKWIRSNDQMFRLKCAKDNDMEKSSNYFYNHFKFSTN